MATKPHIPKGTRDFSPTQMSRRNFIFDAIRDVYRKYGFQQIETPAIENLETLVGSGGEESDKLMFKILNSGDFLSKSNSEALKSKDSSLFANSITEKALRYDLTVPFSRYVVQHRNDHILPFRRFQIQPVWRADRPQKGRYREFYQCDADVIGSNSLLVEIELMKIIDDVFTRLFQGKLNYTIYINNRKILAGLSEIFQVSHKFIELTTIIDKLDKIGVDGVSQELKKEEIPIEIMDIITSLDNIDNNERLSKIETHLSNSTIGKEGILDLEYILKKIELLDIKSAELQFDLGLSRGLGYYTGTIIEVKAPHFPSICGGGRYDDLTGRFGLKDISGVGISFGADRIYDLLLEHDLFPEFNKNSTQVLFINFGEIELEYCLPIASNLRNHGINTEIYPEPAKVKKQLNYANNKRISYVVMAGSNEIEEQKLTVKNMETGDQIGVSKNDLLDHIK